MGPKRHVSTCTWSFTGLSSSFQSLWLCLEEFLKCLATNYNIHCFIRTYFEANNVEIFFCLCHCHLSLTHDLGWAFNGFRVDKLWNIRITKIMQFWAMANGSFTNIVHKIEPNIDPCGNPKAMCSWHFLVEFDWARSVSYRTSEHWILNLWWLGCQEECGWRYRKPWIGRAMWARWFAWCLCYHRFSL